MLLFQKMNKLIILYISCYITTFLFGGNSPIPYRNAHAGSDYSRLSEQSILKNNLFKMNHQFSVSTSIGNGTSSMSGIYSNYTHYSFSERLKLKTGLHLFQNQNNFNVSSSPQTEIGYEFCLEYRLGGNSLLEFQLVNINSTSLPYRKISPINVP